MVSDNGFIWPPATPPRHRHVQFDTVINLRRSIRFWIASYRSTFASYRPSLDGHTSTFVSYMPTLASYRRIVARYRPTVASYRPTVASYRSIFASYKYTVASYMPTIASYRHTITNYRPTIRNKQAVCRLEPRTSQFLDPHSTAELSCHFAHRRIPKWRHTKRLIFTPLYLLSLSTDGNTSVPIHSSRHRERERERERESFLIPSKGWL